jgi:hypothetical protein
MILNMSGHEYAVPCDGIIAKPWLKKAISLTKTMLTGSMARQFQFAILHIFVH